ncbi:MAG: PilC/PilY family type IV pilus protein [Marinobacter sp.]|nr:PilC/PilY family type IV pilus protein [Marinobacter sp.]
MNTIRMLLAGTILVFATLTAQAASLSSKDFTQKPPVLTSRETPLVMLGLSVDNQLFFKAYTDYADINGDGQLDTTYDDTFDYYGYFNSGWCYSYSSTNGRFEPESEAAGTNDHSCNSSAGRWSGNFLNWGTMTRMDVLRKVLYGGKRSTDTAASGATPATTVLQRAYIPSDIHAFAKVYSGSDINEFTPYAASSLTDGALTLCNVSSDNSSNADSSTPQLRLAKGKYRRWSINEGAQCQWNSGANRPAVSDQINKGSEYAVRIETCKDGKDAGSDACELYSTGNAKPVGLLQQYGEKGDLKFGLISGSYDKYISGGTLRKNIGLFGSNTDPGDDEINLANGKFTGIDGIIKTVDSLHIIGWSGSGYGCGGPGISIANFKNGTNACRDWGNPVSEIYAEAVRYFAGATSETSAYAADDTPYIAALKKATWPASLSVNPLNTNTRCAACSIIMISSGVGSFDGDNLSSVSDIEGLSGTGDLDTQTDSVGTQEYGSFTSGVLIGDNDGNPNNANADLLCSSKTLSGLSDALGLCPEAPALEGTYQIAGLAYFAKTNDLRKDTGMTGDQTVDTYGVELSESVPSFNIQVGSGQIRLLPACQSRSGSSGDWIPCTLFDVEVLKTETDSSGKVVAGTLVFHWEDSSWGSDHDLDGSQVVSFCVGGSSSSCDDADNDSRTNATYDDSAVASGTLRISQAVAYSAAGFNLRFGYVVSGSNKDGAPSSTTHDWLVRPGGQNRNDLCQLNTNDSAGNPLLPIPRDAQSNSCSSGQTDHDYFPQSDVFSPSSTNARLLDRPLFLASKYGGFIDRDGSKTPLYNGSTTDTREWDLTNNRTGAAGADGVPDNYFFASNPSLLQNQLQRVFESLVARTASGTNAAVVANSSSGVGAVYQALYQPQYTVGSDTVTWTGTLRSIFIDASGNLREDGNGDDKLGTMTEDPVVKLEFDPSVDKTFVQRYKEDASGNLVVDGAAVELNKLRSVWSAVDQLALASYPEEQRSSYASVDTNRRYIFTAMDRNSDGQVDEQDVVPFTPTDMAGAYSQFYEYFGLSSSALASPLIDYLRGKEITGLRSRTIDYNASGSTSVWRLGDIIHSTPAVVGSPSEGYNVKYSDSSYQDFIDKYRNRRQVVYVGANDGMIHAFNGGFWDAANKKFLTQPLTGTAADQPLGEELWAYVPENLLPHMRWLAEPNYQHVYYMDGEPITFDANVFPVDTTHPKGWGTILVVGMGLGGAPIDTTIAGSTETKRSAYVAFDVTDPEQPPTLLGEITLPELGFTLSKPVVVKRRVPGTATTTTSTTTSTTTDWDNPTVNKWYLVFGSGPIGPDGLSDGNSNQNAKLFAVDLKNLVDSAATTGTSASYYASISGSTIRDTGVGNAFVGGLTAVDWDLNYSDDAVYFGTVEGSLPSPGGRLMRLLIDDNDGASQSYYGIGGANLGTLVNLSRPAQAAPLTVRDRNGDRWILGGTGRSLVPNDNSLAQQQLFVGVKESRDATSHDFNYQAVALSSLIDTTDVAVFANEEVRDVSTGSPQDLYINSKLVSTFDELQTALEAAPGWKIRMHYTAGEPSGQVTSAASLNPSDRNNFAFTEYVPPADSCEIDGESYLRALGVNTGTALPYAPLGSSTTYTITDPDGNVVNMVSNMVLLGPGQASSVTFHEGAEGGTQAITNMSTGSIGGTPFAPPKLENGRQSWRQIDTTSFTF